MSKFYAEQEVFLEFQFHKGTIRTKENDIEKVIKYKFQFHKGTIRTSSRTVTATTFTYFNSIKVRLERLFNVTLKSLRLFQFHKGTIRTKIQNAFRLLDLLFQFHKGTIRTLVRDSFSSSSTEFQFHKGTIRTFSNNDK